MEKKAKTKKFSLIPEYGNLYDLNVRAKYGYLEGSVSIVGNVALFIVKLVLGLFINSIALIADSVHTLSDVGTSGVVIFGFKMSKKPPDESHPHGHGRMEYIATIIIATLLAITGFTFIEHSIERIINMDGLVNQDFVFVIGVIIIISAVVKEFMAQYSAAIGKKIKSDILIADAWHHRSDAITSVAVGVSLIGSAYGYPLLDPIFGIIVSIIIIYVGFELIRKTSSVLLGHAPAKEITTKIEKIVKSIEEVKGINNISVHDYGASKTVSLHISVENNLRLDDAHEIADKIERKIKKAMNFSTIVHLEPQEVKLDKKISEKIIENILNKQKDIVSFHNVQIIGSGRKEDLKMHVIVHNGMSIEQSHELCHRVESIIRDKYGTGDVDIHFEPCGKECKMCTFACKVREPSS